ncbi:unnamed protein product, partial [Phaeothamnion confervicola]
LLPRANVASSNPNCPLTMVIAVSSQGRIFPTHVKILANEINGLAADSYIKCEQIQTVSKERLAHRIGLLDAADLQKVDLALKKVLSLT